MVLRRELHLARPLGAILVGLALGLMSLALSWGMNSLAGIPQLIDAAIAGVLFLLACFVGWLMPRPVVRGELFREPRWLFEVWWLCLRFIVPASAGLLMLWRLGVLG